MKRSFSAIIFDYDGVIANTMGDMYEAWKYAFQKIASYPLNKNDFLKLEGLPANRIAITLLEKYNINSEISRNIVEAKEQYYMIHNHFKLNTGIKTLIYWLKKNNIAVGIVSGAPKERIKKMLGNPLYSLFNIVVGAEDYLAPKPSADTYKFAISTLKLKPMNCCIVENAPFGIQSAKRAGVYCIAIQSTLKKKYLKEADRIFTNFQSLIKYIKYIVKDQKGVL